ncbi:MAG: hypothetical protein HOV83_19610 [Catenulispora sp.]|nr:hypothetical protein [Catenulispora sp.]
MTITAMITADEAVERVMATLPAPMRRTAKRESATLAFLRVGARGLGGEGEWSRRVMITDAARSFTRTTLPIT